MFRAFKGPKTPNTNMAEVGHSRNATRGAKNDTLARVAEDHVLESALLKAKLQKVFKYNNNNNNNSNIAVAI